VLAVRPGRLELETSPALPSELVVLRDLWALDHAMERASRRMQEAIGVTAPQRMILRIVGRFPGIVAGDLARLLFLDAGTVSAALSRMEARALLERKKDESDHRRALLGLTRKGKRLDVPREDSLESAVARALERSTDAERDTLRTMLGRIVEELAANEPSAPNDDKRPAR
jgi:DNA-binding MarR family transcriptional regulator